MDRYELIQPRFKTLILPNANLEKLAEGFRWTEGPVWFRGSRRASVLGPAEQRVMRWSEAAASASFAGIAISRTATPATVRGG